MVKVGMGGEKREVSCIDNEQKRDDKSNLSTLDIMGQPSLMFSFIHV